MTSCKQPEQRLHKWLDGELPVGSSEAREVESHLQTCEICSARIQAWRAVGTQLAQLVDDGVGTVEPLLALQKIRSHIIEAEKRSLVARLQAWWQDLWAFNRRAVAGVAAATALGALCAPLAVYLLDQTSWQGDPEMASVVVESLEFSGNANPVIYRPEGGTTTIIWVEASENGEDTDETEEHF